MVRERELMAKGYRYYGTYNFMQEAELKAKAKELRAQGWRATVVKGPTAVKGIYTYTIWYKSK